MFVYWMSYSYLTGVAAAELRWPCQKFMGSANEGGASKFHNWVSPLKRIHERFVSINWKCNLYNCADDNSLDPSSENFADMMTSSNGNIFRVTGPLCGEFTGPGEFPSQRPVTRSFDVFFDLCLNKRLSKQPWGWWFETPSLSLWRHRNEHNTT